MFVNSGFRNAPGTVERGHWGLNKSETRSRGITGTGRWVCDSFLEDTDASQYCSSFDLQQVGQGA